MECGYYYAPWGGYQWSLWVLYDDYTTACIASSDAIENALTENERDLAGRGVPYLDYITRDSQRDGDSYPTVTQTRLDELVRQWDMPAGILLAVEERPDESLAWGVAADWCDDHGRPVEAEFFRRQMTAVAGR
jgi:uncharacterized protein (TIGR02996 family)